MTLKTDVNWPLGLGSCLKKLRVVDAVCLSRNLMVLAPVGQCGVMSRHQMMVGVKLGVCASLQKRQLMPIAAIMLTIRVLLARSTAAAVQSNYLGTPTMVSSVKSFAVTRMSFSTILKGWQQTRHLHGLLRYGSGSVGVPASKERAASLGAIASCWRRKASVQQMLLQEGNMDWAGQQMLSMGAWNVDRVGMASVISEYIVV